MALLSRPLLEPAAVVDSAQESRVDGVAPPGRQVDVGHVRQERVEEVQRRPPSARHALRESADAARARFEGAVRGALRGRFLLGLAAPEVAPRVVDRRHPPDVLIRQDEVQVHDPGVGCERTGLPGDDLSLGGRGVATERRWAQPGERLLHDEPVAPTEEGEEVARVLRRDRKLLRIGEEAAQDRRLRDLAQPVDRRRVAVPVRPPCEGGEVREALGVDLLAGVHQRGRVELVEGDQHDRCARVDGGGLHLRRVGAHELRDR